MMATSMIDVKTYPAEALHRFAGHVFDRAGLPPADSLLAADVLLAADLRGIDSHGVARLRNYFEALRDGQINPTPEIRVARETVSTATMDGDNGLGLVVGPHANEIAMAKAVEAGSGWVAVRNTNHFGIAGYYVLEALERDLIGMAMTNSSALVAPLFGVGRMLGTNPLAIAFPGLEEPPNRFVLDAMRAGSRIGNDFAGRAQEAADRAEEKLGEAPEKKLEP